ncbi:SNF2 family N-terminal domain-containing protein [Neohortaea acidophila]|uniref:SNF2 family N-terminal domain-containing protein n=1 Tax=Neohortaea acidophila TaxID=245834 RepID=A0A6A6Q1Z4_9PEZI|nr:SNF2 family N-terminal domain-containing protein [Neohortaea acidophila]KAF2485693.1 SNF2 family N-terminal domain-containing protein [Neohortaea acidophila]
MQSPSPKQTPEASDDGVVKIATQPQFGQASPLRNPLQRKKPEPSIFIPRQKKQSFPPNPLPASRPPQQPSSSMNPPPSSQKAFYLPGQQPQPQPAPKYSSALEAAQAFTSQPSKRTFDPDVFEIPMPKNPTLPTIKPRPPPTFSSRGPTTFYQPQVHHRPVIDLTNSPAHDNDAFDPDAAIREESRKFGEPDPFMYVDSSQANENIKNLLEGAFDDDEDKSTTRLRRRAKKTSATGSGDKKAKSLANKLQALSVEDAAASTETPIVEEDQDEEDGTVEGLKVKLLPHQVEGVAWMIDKEIGKGKVKGSLPYGGILADDMGLGKTIQSMTLILTNPRPGPDAKPEHKLHKLPGPEVGKGTLVVAPLALIKQWEDEIKTKVAKSHALRVLVHHGPSRTKSAIELKKYDVVITTYQTLTSEHAASNPTSSTHGAQIGCFGVHWYRIILDEAHSIKNRNAKSTLAACALQSWYRWCLTGTPMQNNLDELQSLIKFLQIKPYNNLGNWKEAITQPMKNGRGGLAMKRLQYFLRAIMKRRTKDILKKDGALNFGGRPTDAVEDGENADSTPSSPKKNPGMKIVKREVATVECDFDEDELDFYSRLESRADRKLEEIKKSKKTDYIGALVLLLRLRQACNHPRLVEMAVNKDKDAMTTGVNGGGAPKQGQVEDGEMDALAAMMGGVSVETKQCDVCQVGLSRAEVEANVVRCKDCEEDLERMRRPKKKKAKEEKKSGKVKKEARSARRRRVVDDSDDDEEEEGEGEWIAEGAEQRIKLGKAGGSDDEDAEGGGESLGSIDSERSDDDDEDEEDSPPRAGTRRRPVKKESQSDEDNDSDESDSDDDDDDDQSISSPTSMLAGLRPSGKSHTKPSTKIRRLLRILHAETPKHKTIVFSQFTSMLDLIEPHLKSSRLAFVRYDGSMRNDAREASLHSLRSDPRCRILLCSLKCGSLGLNLTAASRVVILEPFWNPFVEEQAIDRVHRLNQTVDVKVYRLTVRATVEAKILELQKRKRELARAAIEGGAKAGVNKLSMQDILSLFGRDAEHGSAHHKEDRELWEKFGSDHRLLDGPSSQGASGVARDPTRAMKPGKERLFKEHDFFGRRW